MRGLRSRPGARPAGVFARSQQAAELRRAQASFNLEHMPTTPAPAQVSSGQLEAGVDGHHTKGQVLVVHAPESRSLDHLRHNSRQRSVKLHGASRRPQRRLCVL